MTLSRSTLRDPMQSKTLRQTYERKLVALFRRYKTAALESLTLARENEARALEPPTFRSLGWLTGWTCSLGKQSSLPGK